MLDRVCVGLRLMLPSGNVVRVVRTDGDDFACEYQMLSRLRGEVVFSVYFLRKFGTAC